MSIDVEQLRRRAQWYRDFAKVGTAYEATWRTQMADYFDRMADGAEKRAAEPDDTGLRAD